MHNPIGHKYTNERSGSVAPREREIAFQRGSCPVHAFFLPAHWTQFDSIRPMDGSPVQVETCFGMYASGARLELVEDEELYGSVRLRARRVRLEIVSKTSGSELVKC